MAQSNDLFRGLDDLLTCAVCLDQLSDPRQLPCHHSFCAACIRDFAQGPVYDGWQRSYVVVCPVCRHSVRILTTTENLPIDFRAKELISLRENLTSKEKCCTHCSACALTGSEFMHVCFDCGKVYCPQCHTKHTQMFHDELSCRVEAEKLEKLWCRDHGDFVRCFCLECDKGICEKCLYTTDHLTHTKRDFSEVEMTDESRRIQDTIHDKEASLTQILDDIRTTQDAEDHFVDQARSSIAENKKRLIDQLDRAETSLLKELDDFRSKSRAKRSSIAQQIRTSQDDLNRHKQIYEISRQPIEGVAGIGLKTEQRKRRLQLFRHLDQMKKHQVEPVTKVVFHPGPQVDDAEMLQKYGVLKFGDSKRSETICSTQRVNKTHESNTASRICVKNKSRENKADEVPAPKKLCNVSRNSQEESTSRAYEKAPEQLEETPGTSHDGDNKHTHQTAQRSDISHLYLPYRGSGRSDLRKRLNNSQVKHLLHLGKDSPISSPRQGRCDQMSGQSQVERKPLSGFDKYWREHSIMALSQSHINNCTAPRRRLSDD